MKKVEKYYRKRIGRSGLYNDFSSYVVILATLAASLLFLGYVLEICEVW